MIKNNKLYAFDPARGNKALVGQIIGTSLILVKNAEHLLRKHNAYGIDERAFEEAKRDGITEIRIKRIDRDERLKADMQIWEQKSIVADYGHGKQLFLPISFMSNYEPQLDYPTELERSK